MVRKRRRDAGTPGASLFYPPRVACFLLLLSMLMCIWQWKLLWFVQGLCRGQARRGRRDILKNFFFFVTLHNLPAAVARAFHHERSLTVARERESLHLVRTTAAACSNMQESMF